MSTILPLHSPSPLPPLSLRSPSPPYHSAALYVPVATPVHFHPSLPLFPHTCITQLSCSSSAEPNKIAKLEAELVQAEEDLKVS